MQISLLPLALSLLYTLPTALANPLPQATPSVSTSGFKLLLPGGFYLRSTTGGAPVDLVDSKANGTIYNLDTYDGRVGHQYNRYWQWIIASPATGNDLIYDNGMGGPTGNPLKCTITEGNKFTCVGPKSSRQTYFGICGDWKMRLTEEPLQSPCSSAFSLVAVPP